MIKGFPFRHALFLFITLVLCFGGCRSFGDRQASGAVEFGPNTQSKLPGSAEIAQGSEERGAVNGVSARWTGVQCTNPWGSAETSETLEIDEDSAWEVPRDNAQELLDSALEYCQTSSGLWEKGDPEGAVRALDTAYSLILKMEADHDPELLQQKEDLRFTISKRIVEVYASRLSATQGSSNEIPLVMNNHVYQALASFKNGERKFFLSAYRRSGKYRSQIVGALKEAGLPEELSWLPLIESGFRVRALSRARALGLWQFIASTGYRYGLTRNQWIDERMDPEKSTGEWAVLNRIKKQKINYLDNFWDLYERLPRETASYVPRFLAVLHILKNPKAHGFELPEVEEPVETDEVPIGKQVHLKSIAERVDVDNEILKDLNAELRHNSTPDSPYTLKVPSGKGEILLARLDDIPAWRLSVPSYRVHCVRKGDTLSRLAGHYRTSVRSIMKANGLRSSNAIKVGWKLKIPGRGMDGGG
ncbi:MAG: LysM peptidoglycan-binding domain-containing protein [Desulfobacterota bacterium]|nr:LysM peptidoglycan-binding domain-containing protein [Thermodesulfobacteriota bacterium]